MHVRPPNPCARLRAVRLLVGSAALACLAGTACATTTSTLGVARLPTSAAPSASPSATTSASPLAFSQCMRAHGIANFPDPTGQGDLAISSSMGIDLNSPQFHAAQTACGQYMPKPSASQSAQNEQQMLRYSQCMRSHGLANFPDPTFNANGMVQMQLGAGIDPNSPQFQAAQAACQGDLPGLPGGKGQQATTSGGGTQSGNEIIGGGGQ